MRTAVIGTGLMGRPMAERLLAAGHEVAVYNRTREKAEPLAGKGARLAESPREAVEAAEVAVIMLRDAPAIRDLLLPQGRLFELQGRTLLQMSTIAPDESRELAAATTEAGGRYLEAPVLGSTPQAAAGELLVMAGGDADDFERWRDLLRCFGPEPRRVGGVGQAAAVKLAFNQVIAVQLSAFALAVGMVRRSGVDVDLFADLLRDSALYAEAFDKKLPRWRERDFSEPHFPARLLLKDVDLVLATCEDLGLGSEAAEGVRSIVERVLDLGLGDGDYSALYQAIDPPG